MKKLLYLISLLFLFNFISCSTFAATLYVCEAICQYNFENRHFSKVLRGYSDQGSYSAFLSMERGCLKIQGKLFHYMQDKDKQEYVEIEAHQDNSCKLMKSKILNFNPSSKRYLDSDSEEFPYIASIIKPESAHKSFISRLLPCFGHSIDE